MLTWMFCKDYSRISKTVQFFAKTTVEFEIEYNLMLRGYCTPKQKLVCSVLYLKNFKIILKNNICIL